MALLDSGSFKERIETVFVIGGGQIYEEALPSPLCSAVHFTSVRLNIPWQIGACTCLAKSFVFKMITSS